jgi:hypothetical protein
MSFSESLPDFEIRGATIDDVPLILCFIKKLADYERLAHEVVATEESTTIRLSWAGRGSTLRISSSMNHTAGGDSGQRYCAT